MKTTITHFYNFFEQSSFVQSLIACTVGGVVAYLVCKPRAEIVLHRLRIDKKKFSSVYNPTSKKCEIKAVIQCNLYNKGGKTATVLSSEIKIPSIHNGSKVGELTEFFVNPGQSRHFQWGFHGDFSCKEIKRMKKPMSVLVLLMFDGQKEKKFKGSIIIDKDLIEI
jgi:hypothetical protein